MSRDPWFDNAKMALVTLVVVGHAWTLLEENTAQGYLYRFLYLWHVPAFVLVTGYLSRSFAWERRRLWLLVRTVAVPYLLFEAALALFRYHVGGERLEDLFADPHWPMWYLAALFFWRLLTPVFTRMPGGPWAPVGLSVVISLAAGLWAGDTLDLARVLGLLPFFVLGLCLAPGRTELLRTPAARRVAIGALVLVALASTQVTRFASTEWLYYRSRYDDLGEGDLHAVAIRAALLLTGVVGATAFLALVPRVEGWFARMGTATLVVYLVHGFAVLGAEYAGFEAWGVTRPVLALVLVTVAAVALALLLAWHPVSSRLQVAVDPVGWAQHRAGRAVDLSMAAVRHERGDHRGG